MSQLLKVPAATGHHQVFEVGDHGVRWLGLDLLRLDAGGTWKGELAEEEAAPAEEAAAEEAKAEKAEEEG